MEGVTQAFGPKVLDLTIGRVARAGQYYYSDYESLRKVHLFVWLDRAEVGERSTFSGPEGPSLEEGRRLLDRWILQAGESDVATLLQRLREVAR